MDFDAFFFVTGSVEVLNTKTGYLSKESYVKLGNKKAPYFQHNREEVYKMFEAYEVCFCLLELKIFSLLAFC